MKRPTTRPWVYRLADWIPGFKSTRGTMAQPFHVTAAIDHRYADDDILREILRSPPINFMPKDIKIRSTKGNGYELDLPRKLQDVETDEVLRVLNDDDERQEILDRIERSRGASQTQ